MDFEFNHGTFDHGIDALDAQLEVDGIGLVEVKTEVQPSRSPIAGRASTEAIVSTKQSTIEVVAVGRPSTLLVIEPKPADVGEAPTGSSSTSLKMMPKMIDIVVLEPGEGGGESLVIGWGLYSVPE